MNKFYIQKLFKDVTSLYRLDQIASETTAQEFGALPAGAIWLLTGVCAAWLGMGAYIAVDSVKKKKKK